MRKLRLREVLGLSPQHLAPWLCSYWCLGKSADSDTLQQGPRPSQSPKPFSFKERPFTHSESGFQKSVNCEETVLLMGSSLWFFKCSCSEQLLKLFEILSLPPASGAREREEGLPVLGCVCPRGKQQGRLMSQETRFPGMCCLQIVLLRPPPKSHPCPPPKWYMCYNRWAYIDTS